VVAKSSEDATGALAYERGWNAINELVRSDSTWHGYARNVMFSNNRDGTFSEVSGPVGLDFIEDSRTFVLADLDHDGRLEVILKNRNAPQLRILHNSMKDIGSSIAFCLRGHTSNRDAIGTAITVEAGTLRQTKYLQAGSGFLASTPKSCSLASEIRKELSGQLSTGQAGQLRNSAACRQTTASKSGRALLNLRPNPSLQQSRPIRRQALRRWWNRCLHRSALGSSNP